MSDEDFERRNSIIFLIKNWNMVEYGTELNEYIEENENKFTIAELKVSKEKNRPDISLTVDTVDDYKKACYIVEHSDEEYITTQEAIKLCLLFV